MHAFIQCACVCILYKEWGSLCSPTPCLCMDFICVSTACREGYCVHGTSVPLCSMNNKQNLIVVQRPDVLESSSFTVHAVQSDLVI